MEEQQKRPTNFKELMEQVGMSEEEEAAAAAELVAEVEKAKAGEVDKPKDGEPEKDPDALPDWVEIPPGFRIPVGKTVAFMRFRAAWTDAPEKGDRWCMLWPISDAEQKLAFGRARGEQLRLLSEFAKQTIRLIDGKAPDWTGNNRSAPSVDKFWADIGEKCRVEIQNYYAKTHSLSKDEREDFTKNCFVTRTAVAK